MTDPRDLRTPERVLADARAVGVDLDAIDRMLRMSVENRIRWLDLQLEVRRRVCDIRLLPRAPQASQGADAHPL